MEGLNIAEEKSKGRVAGEAKPSKVSVRYGGTVGYDSSRGEHLRLNDWNRVNQTNRGPGFHENH